MRVVSLGCRTDLALQEHHAVDLYRPLGFAVTEVQLQAELDRAWRA